MIQNNVVMVGLIIRVHFQYSEDLKFHFFSGEHTPAPPKGPCVKLAWSIFPTLIVWSPPPPPPQKDLDNNNSNNNKFNSCVAGSSFPGRMARWEANKAAALENNVNLLHNFTNIIVIRFSLHT